MKQDRTNPFPGLRPFDVDENELFFGRSKQIDELLKRLRQSRFTAVIGTSGSGKSSLVRAGLLAALKRGLMAAVGSRWRIALFRPINDPIGNLAQALEREEVFSAPGGTEQERLADIETRLRRSSLGLVEVVRNARLEPGENLLIVVDQFEELFRFEETFTCENPSDEAAAFVKLLLAAATQPRDVRIFLVLTMRSDFLGESARFRGLPEAINAGQYLIPRMNDDERRQAITAPVAIADGSISEPLVNRLLNDVGDDPRNLPLLQHVLMRTWQHWENDGKTHGDPIGIANYEAVGAISGSLSKHANDIYDELTEVQQSIAKRVFKALTEKGPDGRGLRSPQTFGELCAIAASDGSTSTTVEPDVRAVIDAFRGEGRSFLMPPLTTADDSEETIPLTRDTLIDISHESLISGWDKLQQWVEEEADAARMYKRLAEHAVLFDAGDEKLLTPPALPIFLRWREQNKPNRAWARRYFNPAWASLFNEGGSESSAYYTEFDRADAYLSESQKAFEVEEALKHRAAKQRVRRLAYTVAVLALAFIVAGAAAAVAGVQWKSARASLAIANEATKSANIERARAVEAEKQLARQLKITEGEKNEAEKQKVIAEDAQQKAVDARAEAEQQRDAAKKSEEVARINEDRAIRAQQTVQVALNSAEKSRRDAEANYKFAQASLKEATNERDKANAATAEADKQRIFASKQQMRAETEFYKSDTNLRTLRNIDNQTRHLNAIIRQNDPIHTTVFSPDSKHAFVSTESNAVLFELRAASWQFVPSDFRDVPRLLYKLMDESQLSIDIETAFPTETQELIRKLDDYEKPDEKVTASLVKGFNKLLTDRDLPFAIGFDQIRLRPETQDLLQLFKASKPVDLTQLNRKLLEDAYPFDIAQVNQFNEAQDFSGSHYIFALSPDGQRVAAKYDDQRIDLFDSNANIIATKKSESGIRTVGFSPKGTYIWSSDQEGSAILLWNNNKEDEDKPRSLNVNAAISEAVISPDEKYIAINLASSTEIQIWDMEQGRKILSLDGSAKLPSGDVVDTVSQTSPGRGLTTDFAYSKDGKYIVATFKSHTHVRLWDAATGKLLHVMRGHLCQVNSAEFSPDGSKIVSASEDGAAFIWDAKSGEVKHELRGHRGVLVTLGRKGFRAWMPPIPSPLRIELKHREGGYVPLNSAKFNRDGTKVVTTSVDGRVAVWMPKKSEPFAVRPLELKGYAGNVLTAEFSADDQFVIAGGQDGATRIWRLPKELSAQDVTPSSCEDAARTRAANTRH